MADEIPYTPVTPDSTEATALPGAPIVVPGASFYAASNTIDTVSAPAILGIEVGMAVSGQFITPGTVVTEILDPGVGLGVGISLPTEDESFGTDLTFTAPVAPAGGIAPETDSDNPATSPIAPSPVTPPATAAIAPATDGDNPATSAIAPAAVTPPATAAIAPATDEDDSAAEEIPTGGDGEAPPPAAPHSSPAVRYDVDQDLAEEQEEQGRKNLALDREAAPNFRGLLLGPTADNGVAIQGEQAGVVDAEVVGPADDTIFTLDATNLAVGMYAHDAFPPGTTIQSIGGTAPANTVEFTAGKLASGTDTVRFSVNPTPFPRLALTVGSFTVFLVDHKGNGNFTGDLNVAGSAGITGLLTVDGGINVSGLVDCGEIATATVYTNTLRFSGPGGLQLYASNGDPLANFSDDGELVCPSIDTGAIVANVAIIGGYQLIIGANLTFGATGRDLAAAGTPAAARLALRLGTLLPIILSDLAWTGTTMSGAALVAAYSTGRRVILINGSVAGAYRYVYATNSLSNLFSGNVTQVNWSKSWRASLRARVQVGTNASAKCSFLFGCGNTPAAHDVAARAVSIQIFGDGTTGRLAKIQTHNGSTSTSSSSVAWTPGPTDYVSLTIEWIAGSGFTLYLNGTSIATLITGLPSGLGTAGDTCVAMLAENVSGSSTQVWNEVMSWSHELLD